MCAATVSQNSVRFSYLVRNLLLPFEVSLAEDVRDGDIAERLDNAINDRVGDLGRVRLHVTLSLHLIGIKFGETPKSVIDALLSDKTTYLDNVLVKMSGDPRSMYTVFDKDLGYVVEGEQAPGSTLSGHTVGETVETHLNGYRYWKGDRRFPIDAAGYTTFLGKVEVLLTPTMDILDTPGRGTDSESEAVGSSSAARSSTTTAASSSASLRDLSSSFSSSSFSVGGISDDTRFLAKFGSTGYFWTNDQADDNRFPETTNCVVSGVCRVHKVAPAFVTSKMGISMHEAEECGVTLPHLKNYAVGVNCSLTVTNFAMEELERYRVNCDRSRHRGYCSIAAVVMGNHAHISVLSRADLDSARNGVSCGGSQGKNGKKEDRVKLCYGPRDAWGGKESKNQIQEALCGATEIWVISLEVEEGNKTPKWYTWFPRYISNAQFLQKNVRCQGEYIAHEAILRISQTETVYAGKWVSGGVEVTTRKPSLGIIFIGRECDGLLRNVLYSVCVLLRWIPGPGCLGVDGASTKPVSFVLRTDPRDTTSSDIAGGGLCACVVPTYDVLRNSFGGDYVLRSNKYGRNVREDTTARFFKDNQDVAGYKSIVLNTVVEKIPPTIYLRESDICMSVLYFGGLSNCATPTSKVSGSIFDDMHSTHVPFNFSLAVDHEAVDMVLPYRTFGVDIVRCYGTCLYHVLRDHVYKFDVSSRVELVEDTYGRGEEGRAFQQCLVPHWLYYAEQSIFCLNPSTNSDVKLPLIYDGWYSGFFLISARDNFGAIFSVHRYIRTVKVESPLSAASLKMLSRLLNSDEKWAKDAVNHAVGRMAIESTRMVKMCSTPDIEGVIKSLGAYGGRDGVTHSVNFGEGTVGNDRKPIYQVTVVESLRRYRTLQHIRFAVLEMAALAVTGVCEYLRRIGFEISMVSTDEVVATIPNNSRMGGIFSNREKCEDLIREVKRDIVGKFFVFKEGSVFERGGGAHPSLVSVPDGVVLRETDGADSLSRKRPDGAVAVIKKTANYNLSSRQRVYPPFVDKSVLDVERMREMFEERPFSCIVTGSAGTGKSTLLIEMANSLREKGIGVRVITPTNAARCRLNRDSQNNGAFEATTVHSFLRIDNYGRWGGDVKMSSFNTDVLLFDEAGMGSSYMFEKLSFLVQTRRIRHIVLFLDQYQLNPVGEVSCHYPGGDIMDDLISEGNRKSSGEERTLIEDCVVLVELTNIVRGGDNPVYREYVVGLREDAVSYVERHGYCRELKPTADMRTFADFESFHVTYTNWTRKVINSIHMNEAIFRSLPGKQHLIVDYARLVQEMRNLAGVFGGFIRRIECDGDQYQTMYCTVGMPLIGVVNSDHVVKNEIYYLMKMPLRYERFELESPTSYARPGERWVIAEQHEGGVIGLTTEEFAVSVVPGYAMTVYTVQGMTIQEEPDKSLPKEFLDVVKHRSRIILHELDLISAMSPEMAGRIIYTAMTRVKSPELAMVYKDYRAFLH